MKSLPGNVTAALVADALVPRDFLWITARDHDTGNPVPWGAWSDLGAITATVNAPGGAEVRGFEGAGALVEVSPVSMVTGFGVQTLTITLSQVSPEVEQLVRGYDVRRAPVELYRGFLDPTTMRLVAPAEPVFFGFVDEAPITTPAVGGEGAITLTVASQMQELTRASTATRSDADQRRRNATDAFFEHAATVGDWKILWGQE